MYNFDFNYIKKGTPIVTLSSLGISFNDASRALINDPEKVCVGYDAEARAIGVRAAISNETNPTYEFSTRARNNWVRIGCKDFIKKLAIDTDMDFDKKAAQFIASFDSDLQMLIIHVDEKHRKLQK